MKLLIYTANLGNFEKKQVNEEQVLPEGIDQIDYWQCTDEDFPPRFNSMTPRLQARIVKMMAWQMRPGYDYYLWVDSSCRLPKEDSAKWFMEHLGDADLAVFKHPNRNTIQKEADYLKKRLKLEKDRKPHYRYVLSRYENERIDDQLAVVDPSARLYASTAFIMKNTVEARDAMTIWWLHTSLYHSIDQLSLPHAITSSGATVNVIDEEYMQCQYLEYTRK